MSTHDDALLLALDAVDLCRAALGRGLVATAIVHLVYANRYHAIATMTRPLGSEPSRNESEIREKLASLQNEIISTV